MDGTSDQKRGTHTLPKLRGSPLDIRYARLSGKLLTSRMTTVLVDLLENHPALSQGRKGASTCMIDMA